MNILKPKDPHEIYANFRRRHSINKEEFNEMKAYIRRPKIGKHFVVVWGVFALMTGLCMTIAIADALVDKDFTLLFKPAAGVIERFANLFYIISLFLIAIFLMVIPWVRWSKVYDW